MTHEIPDRIFRCGASDFNHNEILSANETHTDERLKSIADAGFNGIWLRGKLRELVPTDLFRPYVSDADERLQSLVQLCSRANRFGLGVWLYFNEPLGMVQSHRFWQDHPDLTGHRTQIYDTEPRIALCPSTHEVQDYLRCGFSSLLDKAHLAGVLLTTTSEHVSHCWGHVLSNPSSYPNPEEFWAGECHCPRCEPRGPIEVITDVVKLIRGGVKSGRPQAKVVAWDWSWNMHCRPPYRQIVERLPEDVILMGDFERGSVVQRAGKKRLVEEYSLICPGPSKRFRGEARLTAGKRPMFAKLQINTTHELATVPNFPLIVSLYRKFAALHNFGAKGFMATWNFACKPDTLNVYTVNKLARESVGDDERSWLKSLAEEYFGPSADSESVVDAWYGFQRACNHYPLEGHLLLYWGPMNYALVFPLKLQFDRKPMGPAWQEHELGDRLEDTLGHFTLAEMTDLFGKLSVRWSGAVDLYERGLLDAEQQARKQQELAVAVVVGCCFRSTFNIYRWYASRREQATLQMTDEDRRIVLDEIANLQKALPLVKTDSYFGFHEEPKWRMYDAEAIERKLISLQSLVD